jgi:hypothetical protein
MVAVHGRHLSGDLVSAAQVSPNSFAFAATSDTVPLRHKKSAVPLSELPGYGPAEVSMPCTFVLQFLHAADRSKLRIQADRHLLSDPVACIPLGFFSAVRKCEMGKPEPNKGALRGGLGLEVARHAEQLPRHVEVRTDLGKPKTGCGPVEKAFGWNISASREHRPNAWPRGEFRDQVSFSSSWSTSTRAVGDLPTQDPVHRPPAAIRGPSLEIVCAFPVNPRVPQA